MVVGQYGHNAFFNTIGPIAEVGASGGFVARYGTSVTSAARQGIDETVAISGKLRAWPQPVSRGATLQIANSFAAEQPASLYDMQGKRVSSHMITAGKAEITVPSKAGLYLIRAGSETLRIVVE